MGGEGRFQALRLSGGGQRACNLVNTGGVQYGPLGFCVNRGEH